jgi:DNA-binding response OmpR family regulator
MSRLRATRDRKPHMILSTEEEGFVVNPSASNRKRAAGAPEIVIVEDSSATARALELLFNQASYRATAFTEGRQAIEFALQTKPAGAVIDVHLPDMSGLALSEQLREIMGAGAPIIVLSGDSSMEVLSALRGAGATYFFQKPVAATTLLEQFRSLLESNGAGGNVL